MSKSFFRTALDRMITARERQARRYVNGALLHMDDATLTSLGRNRADIEREGAQDYMY